MSNCSCNQDPYQSFWQKLAVKYEKRIQRLTERRHEVRHRLDILQLQLPTYLCYNLKKNPENAQEQMKYLMKLLHGPSEDPGAITTACVCDPCPIKVPDNFPQNLFDFKYPQPIPKFTRTPRKKKRLDSDLKKGLICDCNTCVKQAEQRLREGKPVIDDMIPEKLAPKDDIVNKIDKRLDNALNVIPRNDLRREGHKKLSNVGECACCNNMTTTFKDATVCECDMCPEEVLRRINASDINFEPLPCGCEESKKRKGSDVEVPICQCQSCKLELEKRLGGEPKGQAKEDCICYQNLGEKHDAICNCDLCANKLVQVESTCECKLQDIDILPICACAECQKPEVEEDLASAEKCICNCEICTQVHVVAQTQLDSEESSSHVSCICDCEECQQQKEKLEKKERKEKNVRKERKKKEICVCEARNQSVLRKIMRSETELRNYLKDLICDCGSCTKETIKRLEKEGFVDTIPEKLIPGGGSKKETNKKSNLARECTCCSNMGKTFKDAMVCECDLCAEAVLKRINASNLNFEALACGCQELKQRKVSDVEIPICQCQSCKLELEKRLGESPTDKPKDECICYNHLGKKLDGICDCDICAEKVGFVSPICECKPGDDIAFPVCTCSECQKPQNVHDIASATECICNCEECAHYARARAPQEAEESSSDVQCICNCKECDDWKTRKEENELECICKTRQSTRKTSSESICSCEQEFPAPISCKCSVEMLSCLCAETASKDSKPDSCECSSTSDEFISTPALKTSSTDSCACSVDSAPSTPTLGANASSKIASEDSCICSISPMKSVQESETSCVCFDGTPVEIVQEPRISPKVSGKRSNISSCVCSAESIPETSDQETDSDNKQNMESKGFNDGKLAKRDYFPDAAKVDHALQEQTDQRIVPEKSSDVEEIESVTDYYDAKPTEPEELVRDGTNSKDWVPVTKSICSCKKDADCDLEVKDCATETSCCCIKSDHFFKILVERYVLAPLPMKSSETESEDGNTP